MEFVDIEQERRRYRIPVARLCAQSGIAESSYMRIRSGGQQPRADTVAKLSAGLAAARRGEKTTPADRLFRMLCGLLAYQLDIEIGRVLAHDPQLKATSDPKWMEVQRLRGAVIYVLHAVLGLSNVEVARAARITQAAVTFSVQRFESRRDDPALDRMLDVLEQAVAG